MDNSATDRYSELIQYNTRRLIELLKPIVNIHFVNFQQAAIYPKIQNLIRTFNYTEQDILEKEIQSNFPDFIYNLSLLCPTITRTEIIICCLSFRFPMEKIASCLGYTSTNSIRQHKIRIKNKLTVKSDNSFLFDFIFKST